MVIQCSACQTRFRLADDKVKEEGTRVRCSRCGEIFTVFPAAPAPTEPEPVVANEPPSPRPGPSPSEKADSAAPDQGRESGNGANFEETANPGGATSAFEFDFDFEEPAAEAEPDLGTGSPEGELSWEEASSETVDYDALSFEEEDDLFSGQDAEEGHLDELSFESDLPTGAEEDPFSFDTEPGSGAADEFSFADSDEAPLPDLDSLDSDDAFDWEGASPREEAPDDFEFGAIEAADTPADNDLDSSEAALDSEPSSERESTGPEPKPEAAPAPQPTPPEAPGRPAEAAGKPAKRPPARRPPRKKRKKARRWPTYFLILLLLGLCGAAGYLYWSGRLPEVGRYLDRLAGSGQLPTAASQVQVSNLQSYFVNNRQAGQLFVIDGLAHNGYSEPRSALAVKGILFDGSGKVLRERVVYCGNPLSEKDLKTLPWSKIRERTANQFGDSLSNLNLDPGKSLPFTIVFHDLPANLAEFAVEPTDSLPGSK